MDDRDTAYVSDIPAEAVERVVETHENGSKRRTEYYVGENLAGARQFDESGELDGEWPYRNGVLHGTMYSWHNGKLTSAEPYENGVPHGTARQWGANGVLIGTYTLERGTGLDLWRQDWPDAPPELAEAHYIQDGKAHGWTWWFSDNRLWWERHFYQGDWHGIEREWNLEGRLRRGFPRYWVHNARRTRAQYLKAAAADSTLPPFRIEDNRPVRNFPPEVARHLRAESGQGEISPSSS